MSNSHRAALGRLPLAPRKALRHNSGLRRPWKFKRRTDQLDPSLHWGIAIPLAGQGFFQSWLLPISQRHEFVHDLLQSLQSPFLIGSSDHLFATLQVLAVCFTDLCDFFSQLSNAFFDGLRHTRIG